MDPRMFMFKLLGLTGCTAQVPAADATGEFGGGAGGNDPDDEDAEDADDDEEPEDGDPDDDDADDDPESEDGDEDDESEDGDDEEPEDDEAGDEPEDKDLGELSQRTQKRIKKLVAEGKDLRRRLAEAQKLGGDDGPAILAAATKAGILPRLMTKELAAGLNALADKKNALAYFGKLLDGEEDDFEIGEKTYTRKQLERKERALTAEIGELEARFGKSRDKAVEDARGLLELGLAAQKAGWKPGKGGETKKAKKPRHDEPQRIVSRKKGASKRRVSFEDVGDDDSLEAMIVAERRKKGK